MGVSLRKFLCSGCADGSSDDFFNESLIPTENNVFDVGSLALAIRSLYVGTSIIFTGTTTNILGSTADAADNHTLGINAGGANSNARGGGITLYGNEVASVGGNVDISAGGSTGVINLRTNNTTRWVVDNSGNLVGTLAGHGLQILQGFSQTLPASLTSIIGTAPIFLAARIGGSTNKFANVATGANTSGAMINFLKTRDTTLAATTVVANGDSLGDILAYGADGTAYIPAAMIRFTCAAAPGTNDMPGSIEFHTTTDGTATLSRRWSITMSGDMSGDATTGRHILMNNPAATLFLKSGANGHAGTFIANGVTGVVVNTTQASATMTVQFGLNTVGGTPAGAPYISAVTPGTSFTVKAFAGDTSTYNWTIIRVF